MQDGLLYLCLVEFSPTEDAVKRQQMLGQLTSALEQPHPVLIIGDDRAIVQTYVAGQP